MTEENADALEDVQETPVDEAAAEPHQDDVEDSGQDATDDAEQEESKKDDLPRGVKKSIDRATRQKYEAIRRAEAAEKKLAEIEKRLSVIENPPAPRPNLSDFDTREEYEDALFEWRDSRRQAEPAQETNDSPYDPVLIEDWTDQLQSAREIYTDFDTVAMNPALPVSEAMTSVLLESERGAEVLYELGKNPSESARIAEMTPIQAARELGKIEAKLGQRNKSASKPSKAPEPITPAGASAKVDKEPHEQSFDEFTKWRKKYISQRR